MRCTYTFDFLSPYSYLAWCWLRANSQLYKERVHFTYRPVTLAPLIKHYETKGPAEIAPKREYLMRNCLRLSALHNIPFQPPEQLPFNSLYALRIALKECSFQDQAQVIDIFFRAAWEEGLDLGKAEIVESVLSKNGFPGPEWIERTGDKDLRAQLKKNTKEALGEGVFGLPTFTVEGREPENNEIFWGFDSIPHLKLYLEGNDPLDKEKLKHFQSRYLE